MESEEAVQVYVRVRPEVVEEGENATNEGAATTPPSSSSPPCVQLIDNSTIRLFQPDSHRSNKSSASAADDKYYTFDRVFGDQTTQEEIYDSVAAHVRAVVHGYNSTIFAYGSTGSGKSYTMTGCSSAPGVIPRAVSDIFSMIETTANIENDVFFYIRLSYVELYNNQFRNLLEFASKELSVKENEKADASVISQSSRGGDDSSDVSLNTSTASGKELALRRLSAPVQFASSVRGSNPMRADKIEVRESQSTGIFLAGPNLRIPITSAREAFQLINRGNKYRAIGATQCNDQSSRSHAILTLHVESRSTPNDSSNNNTNTSSATNTSTHSSSNSEWRIGKMHLVDLAGSERLALSAAEGETLAETQAINLSLTALGDVLSALSKNASITAQQKKSKGVNGKQGGAKQSPSIVPVPYRNSKLTHLLKDSLGGNSKTIMIANIRQTEEYFQMTSVSLMYASRAKKVKNHSFVNRNIIGDSGIQVVSSEIERLKGRLDERTNEFERLRIEQMRDAKENITLKMKLEELNRANEVEKKQLEKQMSHVIHSQAGQLASQRQKISSLQKALQDELAISQNRIAEQDKEIKWLKKALDVSNMEAKQPKEQLQRMQKVLDGWQLQAESTQRELSESMKVVEDLRAHSTSLSGQLAMSKASQQQLQEELGERTQELSGLAMSSQKTETRQSNKIDELEKTIEGLQESIRTTANELQQKERVCADVERRLELALENFRKLSSENDQTVENLKRDYTSRINVLEKERSELSSKLETTVGNLERQSADAVTSATTKLKESERKRKIYKERIAELEEDVTSKNEEIELMKETIKALESKVSVLSDKNSEAAAQITQLSEQSQHRESEYERELQELKRVNKFLVQKAEKDMKDSYEEQIATMRSAHEDEMQNSRRQHEEEKQKLLQRHEDQMESHTDRLVKSRLDNEIGKIKNLHSIEIESLRVMYEKEMEKEKQELIEEWEQKLNSQLTQLSNENSDRLNEMEKSLLEERKHSTTKEQFTMHEMETMENKFNEEIARLSEAMQQSEARSEEKIEELKAKYKEKFKDSLDKQKSYYDKSREEALEKLRNELDLEKSEELDVLRREFEQSLKNLNDERQETLRVTLEEQKETIEKEFATKHAQIAEKYAMELSNQRKEHESQIAEIASAHNKVIEVHKERKAEMESAHCAQINSLESRIAEMETEHGTKLQEIAMAQQKLTAARETVMKELEEQHSLAISEQEASFRTQIEQLEHDHSDKLQKLTSDNADLDLKLKNLERTLIKRENAHVDEVLEIREKGAQELKECVEKEVEATTKKYEAKVKHLQDQLEGRDVMIESSQKEVEGVRILMEEQQTKFANSIAKLKTEHTNNLTKKEEKLKNIAAKNISDLKATHESTIEELKAHYESTIQKAKTAHEKETSKIQKLHQKEISKMKNGYEERINKDLEPTISSLNEKIEEFNASIEELNVAIDDKDSSLRKLTSEMNLKDTKISELSMLLEETKKAHEEALNQIADTHDDQLQSIASAHKRAITAREKIQMEKDQELLEQRRTLESKISELENDLKVKLHDLQQEHSNELSTITSNHDNAVQEREKSHDQELNELKTKIYELEADHESHLKNVINEYESRHEAHIVEITSDYESKHRDHLDEVIAAHKQAHSQFTDRMTSSLQSKDSTIQEMEIALQSKDSTIQEVKTTIERVQMERDALRVQFEEDATKLNDLHSQSMDALKKSQATLEQAMQSQHKQEVEDLTNACNLKLSTMENLLKGKEEHINKLQQEIADTTISHKEMNAALNDQLAQLSDDHEEQMKILRLDKDNSTEQYQQELSLLKNNSNVAISKLKDELRRLETDYENQSKALAESVSNEYSLSELVEEKDSAITELKKSHEEHLQEVLTAHDRATKARDVHHLEKEKNWSTEIQTLKQRIIDLEGEKIQLQDDAAKQLARSVESQVNATEEKYKEDMRLQKEQIEKAHRNALDSKDMMINELNHVLTDVKRSMGEEIKSLKSSVVEKDEIISKIASDAKDQLSDIKVKHQEMMEIYKTETEQKYNSFQETHKEKVDMALSKQAIKLQEEFQEMKASLSNQYKVELENSRRSMEMEHRKKIEDLEKGHSEATRKSQTHFQDLLLSTNETQKKAMDSMMDAHKRELDRVMKLHDDQLAALKQGQDEKNQQLVDMRNEMKAKEQDLQAKFNDILDAERLKTSSSTTKCAELEAKIQRIQSELSDEKSRQIEIVEAHADQIKTMRAEFDQRIESDRLIWEKETENSVSTALQNQAAQLKKSHLTEMELLNEGHKENVSIYEEHKTKLTLSLDQTKNSRENDRKVFDEELSALRSKYEGILGELKLEQASKLKEANSVINSLGERLQNAQSRQKESEDAYRREIDDLKSQISKLDKEKFEMESKLKIEAVNARMEHQRGVEAVQLETKREADKVHMAAMRELKEKTTADVEAALREEMEELKKDFERVREKMECDLNAQIVELETEKGTLVEQLKSIRDEMEASKSDAVENALRAQYDTLHGDYLKQLQQQAGSMMDLLSSDQGSEHLNLKEIQQRFVDVMQDMPDLWKVKSANNDKKGTVNTVVSETPVIASTSTTQQADTSKMSPKRQNQNTPLHLLRDGLSSSKPLVSSSDDNNESENTYSGTNIPWSSPALKSSPIDQLGSAILDGDVQGIRAVIRSKGDNLQSNFWRNAVKKVLPLHKCIAGFQHHGNSKLLVLSIETLIQLGADITAVDKDGNTVLHEAIRIGSSKSVGKVVDTLLQRGCPPGDRNRNGQTPLHLECKHTREASLHVVDFLFRAGAEPRPGDGQIMGIPPPLTLVLQRGNAHDVGDVAQGGVKADHTGKNSERYWCPLAARLLQAGVKWDTAYQTKERGETQLHLLLSAYPPYRDQMEEYMFLVDTALSVGANPLIENNKGRNCIFVFCMTISHVVDTQYPESREILKRLIHTCGDKNIGGTDRSGKSVFDIMETVPCSSLTVCKKLLQKSFTSSMDQERKLHHQIRADSGWGGKGKIERQTSFERRNEHESSSPGFSQDDYDDATISTKNSSRTVASAT